MSNQPKDTRNASQKIADLERALMSMYQAFDGLVRENQTIKEAIKILGNKVESIAQLSNLSDEVLSAQMIVNNVKELDAKVAQEVAAGRFVPTDKIADDTFVVGEETNGEGKVVNPRLQFVLTALPTKELQDTLRGHEVGDVVVLKEGAFNYVVKQIFKLVRPDAPALTETPSEEVSVEEQATGTESLSAE